MANVITPNMSLVVPGVGTESGPQYATDINGDLTILDQHDHSPGNGVQITPSGLNINSILNVNNQTLENVGLVNLEAQGSSPSTNSSVYSIGVDLYFKDGSGNVIRMTQSGGVAGTSGSITGLVSPASAVYSAGTFTFESNVLTAANLDGASLTLRNTTASSFGLTLNPPSAMGANYSLTLPVVPAQTNVMVLDNSGNMASITYDAVGQDMTSVGANAIGVSMTSTGANAIGESMTSTGANAVAISMSTIGSNAVIGGVTSVSTTVANIIGNAIDTGSANNIAVEMVHPNFSGNYAQVAGQSIVTAQGSPTSALAVIRGVVNSSGTIIHGEGFSVSHTGTGQYTITFGGTFTDNPAVVVTPIGEGIGTLSGVPSTTSVMIILYNAAGSSALDLPFSFMVMGPR